VLLPFELSGDICSPSSLISRDKHTLSLFSFHHFIMAAAGPSQKQIAKFKKMFADLDKDQDGFISPSEFKESMALFGEDFTEDEVKQIMERADTNKDGQLDFDEFVKFISGL
jgi:Ca2+-binding EF-hand superfamily protein